MSIKGEVGNAPGFVFTHPLDEDVGDHVTRAQLVGAAEDRFPDRVAADQRVRIERGTDASAA